MGGRVLLVVVFLCFFVCFLILHCILSPIGLKCKRVSVIEAATHQNLDECVRVCVSVVAHSIPRLLENETKGATSPDV